MSNHDPRTSPRKARVCPRKDCIWRSFGDPEARCPEHRDGVDQPDRPYQGVVPKRP